MQTGERGRSEKSEGRRDNGKREEGCRLDKEGKVRRVKGEGGRREKGDK
jgi:hypothetical protein